ncbi:MAG TPA: dienelactone hydrolase family protein [Chthoniobacterales bacterium]|jgi:dienelactone hydrolase|nr:dienelactone hydrolase family protein [Chthoniobacterales bacterium]
MRICFSKAKLFVHLVPLLLVAVSSGETLSFEYDRTQPLALREEGISERDGIQFREITYANTDGTRNAATIVSPTAVTEPRPGILFVHWYGPPAPTSNRTEFSPDAVELAKGGALSLLIDTQWSRPEYFDERTRAGDYDRSVRQVKDLRRALDVLVAQPKIDLKRVAYVGHDFGAMYGVLAAACDPRVRSIVFMAGTPSFSDWFLYGEPKLQGEARQKFVDELKPLDPIAYLPKLEIPILFQFATSDIHVPKTRADALVKAAAEPKEVRFYLAEHELNEQAAQERIAWLKRTLKLETPNGPTADSRRSD